MDNLRAALDNYLEAVTRSYRESSKPNNVFEEELAFINLRIAALKQTNLIFRFMDNKFVEIDTSRVTTAAFGVQPGDLLRRNQNGQEMTVVGVERGKLVVKDEYEQLHYWNNTDYDGTE